MDSKEVLQYLAQLERQLIKAYGSTYATVIEIAEVRRAIENGESFKWSDNKATAAKVDKLLKKLIEKVKTLIANGIMASYNNGAKNIDGMLVKALGIRQTKQKQVVTEICKAATAKQREMGMTASARLNARRGGIQASAAIWQQNAKKELEIIIQNGISEGKSPKAIATSIRGYLLEPHRYEQSVLNKETGKLERSEAARNYHPGQGVYRSSYKNALRMARTEMTEAYRAAEWESYQNNPLIKAYEIRLSGNHTTKKVVKGKSTVVPLNDICDKLTGVYPKTFKWTGWHPQCRCVMIPITCSQKEFRELLEARKKDREDKKQGKEAKAVKKLEQQAANKPLPKQFTDWIRDNQARIDLAKKKGGSIPGWITDNYSTQDPTPNKLTPLQIAAQRHAERTQDIINAIQQAWDARKARMKQDVLNKMQPEELIPEGYGNTIKQCKKSAEIMNITTYKELENYVQRNNIAETVVLSTVPLNYAKEICSIYAQYQEEWHLPKIRILGTKRMSALAHAHGNLMEISPSVFNKTNAPKEVISTYKSCVSEYVNNEKKKINDYKGRCKFWEEEAQKALDIGNKARYNYYKNIIKDIQKEIDKIENKLKNGFSRHNIFFSEQTVLRNTVQHEFGHTIDDRLLGTINGKAFKTTQISDAKAVALRNEWVLMYKKYKDTCGWLSEYGTKTSREFFAECMVLYMEKGGVGLPIEIKQWIDNLKNFATIIP